MKETAGVLRAFVLTAVLAAPGFAGDEEMFLPPADREAVVTHLVTKLSHSEASEMQNAAFLLGEAKATEAVIPLMRMLHEGEESCRIVAALALSRIGDARGTFAVKRAAKFDTSEKVRTLSAWYYEQYVKAGTFTFVPVGSSVSDNVADR